MVKELEPILEKLLFMEAFNASMEVNIPTSAMIPNAMIRMVRTVRSFWIMLDVREMEMCPARFIVQR